MITTHTTPRPRAAMRVFTSVEVCQLTGVSYRQLDYWDRTGSVVATWPARGSGTQRRYSHADLIAVHAVAQLRRFGLPLHRAFVAAQLIREVAPDGVLPPDLYLVVTRDTIRAVDIGDFGEVLRFGGSVVPLVAPDLPEHNVYRIERIPA